MQRATGKPVLIAVGGLDAVGTGRQAELLALGLRERGWKIHVAVTSAGGGMADRLAAAGIPVHRVGRRPVADIAAACRLAGLARSLRAAAVLGCGRRQLPLVAAAGLAVPGVRTVGLVTAAVRGAGQGWAVRRLDRVIAVSPAVAAACRRRGVAEQRVTVVPPGIVADPGRGLSRAEIASRLGLDPAADWTLCVAPLVAASRLERLLWGIDQLGVVRKGMQHVLVGSGPLLGRVRRRARVQELAERLFVFRHCDVLPDLIGEAACVWQPGSVAYGGVILDAMGRGVPAVAVEDDASCQLVASGESGWLVPALPESEFPRRAFNLLEDPGMREAFAAAARIRAEKEFPAEPMIAGVAAVLETIA